jgi:hypothetical protein
MTAGLPGTGVSGFFYFMLVLLMPVRELYRTLRGQSSVARWKLIGFQWFITVSIFAVVTVEYILLLLGLGWLQNTNSIFGRFLDWATGGRAIVLEFHAFGLIVSLLVLAAVVAFTYMVNWGQQWGLIGRTAQSPALVVDHTRNGSSP